MDEFLEMMSKRQWEVNHLEEIMDVFKVLDKNGDGFINAAELRHIMSKLGVKISDQEAQDMINEADEDGDGKLNNVGKSSITMVAPKVMHPICFHGIYQRNRERRISTETH